MPTTPNNIIVPADKGSSVTVEGTNAANLLTPID